MAEEGILYNFKGRTRPTLTINRESIREMSNEVYGTESFLHDQLVQEISNIIKAHFENNPYTKTDAVLSYIKEYLCQKFNVVTYYCIMECLSLDVFSEYTEYGIPIKALFNQSSLYISPFPEIHYHFSFLWLMQVALCNAEQIAVEGDSVSVRMLCKQKNKDNLRLCMSDNLLICATTWDGAYAHYDVVSNLWPLVPKRLYELYKAEKMLTVNSKTISKGGLYIHGGLPNIAVLDPFDTFDMIQSHSVISRADILLLLNKDTESSVMLQYPFMILRMTPKRSM